MTVTQTLGTTAKKKMAPPNTKELVSTSTMTQMEISAAQNANSQEVVASDVLIPRLLLGQGISPMVMSRKAGVGDIVRSTTFEKLGDPENPIDIVPIKMVNSWINFETVPGMNQPQFRGMEHRGGIKNAQGNIVSTNEDLPWEYSGPNGEEMFRHKAITLYALIPADVAAYDDEIKKSIETGQAPDLDRTVLPVVLTFQSTSFKHAGKKCASFFNNVRVNAMKLKGKVEVAPFQYILTLSTKEEKKGTASWYVYDFGTPKALKDSVVREEAARWSTILSTTAIKTDDSGEVLEEHSRTDIITEMEV